MLCGVRVQKGLFRTGFNPAAFLVVFMESFFLFLGTCHRYLCLHVQIRYRGGIESDFQFPESFQFLYRFLRLRIFVDLFISFVFINMFACVQVLIVLLPGDQRRFGIYQSG